MWYFRFLFNTMLIKVVSDILKYSAASRKFRLLLSSILLILLSIVLLLKVLEILLNPLDIPSEMNMPLVCNPFEIIDAAMIIEIAKEKIEIGNSLSFDTKIPLLKS